MTTIQDTDEAGDLQERMERVEYDTLDGSTCRAEIVGIEEREGDIEVTVELPSGRTHAERFVMPEIASDRYRFVRLLNETGYALSTLDHAVGAEITVDITEDGPEIAVPPPEETDRTRLHAVADRIPEPAVGLAGLVLVLLTAPVTGPFVLRRWTEEQFDERPDWIEIMLAMLMLIPVWLVTIGAMYFYLVQLLFL